MATKLPKPSSNAENTAVEEEVKSAKEERNAEAEERMAETLTDAANTSLFDDDDNVFEMLRGYTDKDGVLHKDFEVRYITGRDEEAINKADIKSNGSKVVTTLLARCVTRIGTLYASKIGMGTWTTIIRDLYVGDQDYMLLRLREYSIGDTIKANHVCPNEDCKAKLTSELGVDELEIVPFVTDVIEFDLPRGFKDKHGVIHKTGTMRLPTGLDREILTPVARQNLAKGETVMLTRIMKFDDGYPVDDDVTGGLSIKDREYLNALQRDNYFGVNQDFEVTCDTCGETFTATLNALNFI